MTTLTTDQRAALSLATGYWNSLSSATAAEAADAAIVEPHQVVQTHETLADFIASRGKGVVRATPAGELHVWSGVQLGRGKTRGAIFAMFFDGVAASYFTGEA